ncbi:response regulator transcription factor [Kocuria sp. cx-455]|uniref:response regulator n=1 Tax=unclassified Candidatus Sulfotelmatobacter TaxID=2635724 RepID=UPI001687AA32|nr:MULTISPECIES: response regulator transcription factor [unclassified Candidatus Sulfotelmatobacter]MBD2761886.1 response regulator transcription factor [Kocuria sp. cx-116]MBD2763884.1 response regulator transcription factor [Kocuria sp. cx-455]
MEEPPAAPIRLLLADDQKLMRQALRVFIENEPGMEVVGEAQDGRSAVIQAKTLQPDVVLMDLQMPRLDGVAATEEVLVECPNTKVVAVTTFHSEEYVIPALRAGASAYLLKDSEPEDIVAGIRSAIAGEFMASPRVTEVLVNSVVSNPSRPKNDPESVAQGLQLSEREIDVINLLCDGKSNREISQGLFIAEPTVKSHIGRIMTKMGVRDRVQVVIKAYRNGLVTLD